MKDTKMNLMIRTVMLAVMAAVATGTLFAQDSKGGKLVGTWDAVVTIRDCDTGAALNTFASITSFNQGGTSIGSTSGIPQANRTPEHGVWRHVRGHMYEFTFKTFSFSPTGTPVGYSIITHDIKLDRGGDTYTSAGIAQIFLMNGVQVAQGCSDAVGTRFGF